MKENGTADATGAGKATTTSFPLTAAWQRDRRDSAIAPNKGHYQRANLELSAIGTLAYYRAVYQDQYFQPITRSMTLALNGEADYGRGFGGKKYPIFKNFYAGGIGSVRGYEGSSLVGTNIDAVTGESTGRLDPLDCECRAAISISRLRK